ncbi:sulfite exporter TauE/SafE family protein [Xanthobacter sp. V4C-4]|uniref:sulfite exporter TauE/SafE family protein n=1 Tax=Xanthobacter cornucopiae TaxID=3119924 RepID=UPI00372881C6
MHAPSRPLFTFSVGGAIGALGGLIGLGGAEFRLPLLIGAFRFDALDAVILNKAVSLVVVASALPFRTGAVPLADLIGQWGVVVNLLAGSLIGAWIGAGWATRLASHAFFRLISVLLAVIALVLVTLHHPNAHAALFSGATLMAAGVAAGFVIGIVAALLGVAGGELLIPTLVLLFGVDIKLAGSLALVVSLPTMLVGLARYSRDRAFGVLGQNKGFLALMALGSIAGTFVGSRLLGIVPSAVMMPVLALVLLWSAVKLWRHP